MIIIPDYHEKVGYRKLYIGLFYPDNICPDWKRAQNGIFGRTTSDFDSLPSVYDLPDPFVLAAEYLL
ncbi:MAG: hypothetical protein A2W90_06355 [Bacteroidetes bacterium GWF2_42_66]|nr:MAG: hypothetical protein A2W92_20865 [Bacteroidetes bacterium GWA2_42_15]OFX99634.1 MAG: hypothetical protein A2W89_00400 [Bacteroidetes bacterium GWE2_42_39]OFY39547.1 MAG: hypothetical protein A2W90_06355 [Bacteroidetes bacterium GWF2_42_66]HBL73616.1 hypothetical protein [Prolixibacteraceae bacterium]HCU63880.1 hypothetical protein [Prolixibacteraceae bacterium]